MTGVHDLTNRIDQELEAEVQRRKAESQEVARINREDPVAKNRFPKFLAASTEQRDGQTYYFVDEETRREFDKTPAGKP